MIGKRIGVLGAGNMASALIRGLLTASVVEASQVSASDIRVERLNELRKDYGINVTSDNRSLVANAEVVICALKPALVQPVLSGISDAFAPNALLISIAAGVASSTLEHCVPQTVRVIRVMPNTPALALAGASAIAKGVRATDDDVQTALTLFEAVGKTVVVGENSIDAVTGLSGSGPAYAMLVIEALADGGVRVGLPRDVALTLAAQTLYGSAKLLLDSGQHPGTLKDLVTSPAGTTITGLQVLERAGVRGAFIDAVQAATDRAEELGRRASASNDRVGSQK